MLNKDFGRGLEDRTQKFAFRVIQLSSTLPNTPEGRVVRNQFTKSGTSIGANYREVNRSRSKADFIHKLKICESEASETIFWLKIMKDQFWGNKEEVQYLIKESEELLGIFTSAGYKMRKKRS